jgi:hypothetical protein
MHQQTGTSQISPENAKPAFINTMQNLTSPFSFIYTRKNSYKIYL